MSYQDFLSHRYCCGCGVALDESLVFDELEFTVRKRSSLVDDVSRPVAKRIIADNVALIKTIPSDYFPKIAYRVLGYFDFRYTKTEIEKFLVEQCGVSRARAKLIASDQLAKAEQLLKVAKWKKRGVNRVMWCHSIRQEEPRVYHVIKWDGVSGLSDGKPNGLNGYTFDLDHPPVIDLKTGERGFPGRLVSCHCYLKSVR